MTRVLVALLLVAVLALAANFRLYLKDGTYHLVREYQVNGDRVRFYSVERSEWEEIPLNLTDLKRTEAENQEHEQTIRKESAEAAAEEKFEREQREERERIPVESGVYWVDGKELKTIIRSLTATQSQKETATRKLQALPRNASPVRIRNRCQLSGRPRGFVRRFGLSRIAFRDMALEGKIPGVRKASW